MRLRLSTRACYSGLLVGAMLVVAGDGVRAQAPPQHAPPPPAPSHHHDAAPHVEHGASPSLSAEEEERVAAVIERVREVTGRYHDLDAAIGAGYRLVGPDFPGMGEHWVHPQYLLQRDLSVERPAILSYVRIDGHPVLTGVAYARPVRSGETPPDFIAPGLWHYHSGTVDEETLLLNPRSMDHDARDQPRLAMFHAWVWTENPSGLFAQDNWALPFIRLGLPVPDAVLPQAGKALFLESDGVDYYARLIDVAGEPGEADRAAVRSVLERFHQRLQVPLQRLQGVNAVTAQDQDELAALWEELWRAIEDAVSPAVWKRIEMLAG